ncbi:hypothetical protein EON65_13535 [archaeon]|nr:MAG: hypothetical protein EON65_13535 [archaeon]
MAWLDEIGAEAIDPLMYNAADLLEQARNALSPADFALYLRAGMCTRAFEAFEADEAQQWLKDLKSDAAEAAKKEAMEVKCKARLKEIDGMSKSPIALIRVHILHQLPNGLVIYQRK